VVAELEIDNWGEHRRIHARPLARLVVADAIGVFSPLKDRKTRVERGLESGRAHLAHAAAHTGDRLVADDDQPLLVTGLHADITQPLVKREHAAGWGISGRRCWKTSSTRRSSGSLANSAPSNASSVRSISSTTPSTLLAITSSW